MTTAANVVLLWMTVSVRFTNGYPKMQSFVSPLLYNWAKELLNNATWRIGSQELHSPAVGTFQAPLPLPQPWLALETGTSLSLWRYSLTCLSFQQIIFLEGCAMSRRSWTVGNQEIHSVPGCTEKASRAEISLVCIWVTAFGWRGITQKCQTINLGLALIGHF